MPAAVYRMMRLLCALVGDLPIGTNLRLLHLLWMLVSGRLLAARGGLFPGLSDCGLSAAAVRRAWAAVGQGGWHSEQLLTRWAAIAQAEGHWQPQRRPRSPQRPVGQAAFGQAGEQRPARGEQPPAHQHPQQVHQPQVRPDRHRLDHRAEEAQHAIDCIRHQVIPPASHGPSTLTLPDGFPGASRCLPGAQLAETRVTMIRQYAPL